MPVRSIVTRCAGSVRRRSVTLVGLCAVLLVVIGVVDAPPVAQIAMFGALVAAALVALGESGGRTGTPRLSPSPSQIDGRRLRGAFRRQEQPDTPGRPMPRAPGAVHGPDRWLSFA